MSRSLVRLFHATPTANGKVRLFVKYCWWNQKLVKNEKRIRIVKSKDLTFLNYIYEFQQ